MKELLLALSFSLIATPASANWLDWLLAEAERSMVETRCAEPNSSLHCPDGGDRSHDRDRGEPSNGNGNGGEKDDKGCGYD